MSPFEEAFEKEYIVCTHAVTDHLIMCGPNSNYEDCSKSVDHRAEAEIVYQKVLEGRRG